MKLVLGEDAPVRGKRSMSVRVADWPAEKHRIERFRYDIYIAEQGKRLPWADHHNRLLPDELDANATHFLCETVDGIVGYARVHINHVPPHLCDAFELEELLHNSSLKFSYLSKVMLDCSRRGGIAFASLTRYLYKHLRLREINAGFCHANEQLATLYEGFGWQRVGPAMMLPHMAPQIPMVLLPEDRESLRGTRPLLYDLEMEFTPAARGRMADAGVAAVA